MTVRMLFLMWIDRICDFVRIFFDVDGTFSLLVKES